MLATLLSIVNYLEFFATTLGLLVGTAVAALVFSLVIVRPERKAA